MVRPDFVLFGGSGARGSFSYADTSVFGDRQLRTVYPQADNNPVVPGGGGGARANQQMKQGSHAIGYSPHGIVLIRLSRVE
jgi:hypothetical protein